MARQTGRATIQADGDTLATKSGGARIKFGGKAREGGMTDQGTFVYKERDEPSAVEADIVHMLATDVDALRNADNITINFFTDTGQEWTVAGAVYEDSDALADGMWKVKFSGPPAQRVA
ncbi:MAG: phage tail tube protein [Deltaproteobacteria bacterium]|nr:phage tail tube protein [Deltaproteobacteria bacterium]